MQHLLRNKIKYLIIIFGLAPACGFAQFGYEINMPDHDEKAVRFGINAGLNRSHYNFTHHPQFLSFDSVNVVESVNSTGINLAWLVNFRISNHFDFRTYPVNLVFTEKEFLYTLRFPDKPAKEDTITSKKVQGITLAFPLQLKFTSDRIDNFKVYMMIGTKLEYDLAANSGKKNNTDAITLKKFDYGVEAGLGFHFYFPVFVLTPEIKIGYGMANVHDRKASTKYSNVIDKVNSRAISFSLTVE